MTWSTPMTAVANTGLTAAQWNASVRDNLLETSVAKATTAGRIFVATGVNTLAEREITESEILTQETSTRTTYGNITTTGPTVTVTTGALAITSVSAQMFNSGANNMYSSYAISGATTDASSDTRALAFQAGAGDQIRATSTVLSTLTGGSNTFKVEYRTSAGTGTWDDRRILVIAL